MGVKSGIVTTWNLVRKVRGHGVQGDEVQFLKVLDGEFTHFLF